jgi:hypothetical protein
MSEISDPRKIILEAWNQLPEEHRSDFVICLMIIKDFLGQEWLDRHLDPDQPKDGFFKLADSITEADTRNVATEKTTTKFLQGVTGNESLAKRIAPKIMRLVKSSLTRYSLGILTLGSTALAVYQIYRDSDRITASPAVASPVSADKYILVGTIDEKGELHGVPHPPSPSERSSR